MSSDYPHDLPPEAIGLGTLMFEHKVGSSQYRQAIFSAVFLVLANFAIVFVVVYYSKDEVSWISR